MAETLTAAVNPLVAERDSGSIPHDIAFTTLAVAGMHCGACMRKVEDALMALPGIVSARVSLSTKRVTVATATRAPTPEPLIEALERVGFAATVVVEANPGTRAGNTRDYLQRLGVAGFAAANIMLLSVSVWSGHGSDMPASLQTMFHWLSAAIALPAIAYAGQPFFKSARRALRARQLNMDVPISLGVLLATGMSLFQTVRGSEQVYFDAAISLLFFLLIGRALDQFVRTRAASAAENLLGLRAPVTTVAGANGQFERIATAEVRPGMMVLIAAGERFPVDVRVEQGNGLVDESLLTGESRPRPVGAGDKVFAGTIALSGPFEAAATANADNTLLAEIARLMQTAEQARGRYVRLADRAARLYAPAVHILGLSTFLGWLATGHNWEASLTAAIAVLIITCPCALALAVPAVQVAATSRLFRHGIVLKAADGLERLAEVDTIIFDKTGTLTLGEPCLTAASEISGPTLARAAAVATYSRHPYSKAIVRAARERSLALPSATGVTEIAGEGLIATIDGISVRLGSAHHCGATDAAAVDATLWFKQGDGVPQSFLLGDRVRRDARVVVRVLEQHGYSIEMLSGDRADAVAEVARAVGIETARAAQSPADKIRHVEAMQRAGRKVLMIGDGLNDAPALAAGHASLSPANAADISQTTADAVFQGEGLSPIVETLLVAKAAKRRALENFAIAIGYNVVFVPMAIVGMVTPLIAAIAMSASSLAVTLNALRLVRYGREMMR